MHDVSLRQSHLIGQLASTLKALFEMYDVHSEAVIVGNAVSLAS